MGVLALSEICVTELLEDSSSLISEESSSFILEDSSPFTSAVTKILISISPSANISFRVFSPSERIVFANSPESITVPFSSVTPSVFSVAAKPPPMRIATVSDVEFVLMTILSPERCGICPDDDTFA